jgi:hypothetical protein
MLEFRVSSTGKRVLQEQRGTGVPASTAAAHSIWPPSGRFCLLALGTWYSVAAHRKAKGTGGGHEGVLLVCTWEAPYARYLV